MDYLSIGFVFFAAASSGEHDNSAKSTSIQVFLNLVAYLLNSNTFQFAIKEYLWPLQFSFNLYILPTRQFQISAKTVWSAQLAP